jgi:hypothetical protein
MTEYERSTAPCTFSRTARRARATGKSDASVVVALTTKAVAAAEVNAKTAKTAARSVTVTIAPAMASAATAVVAATVAPAGTATGATSGPCPPFHRCELEPHLNRAPNPARHPGPTPPYARSLSMSRR